MKTAIEQKKKTLLLIQKIKSNNDAISSFLRGEISYSQIEQKGITIAKPI